MPKLGNYSQEMDQPERGKAALIAMRQRETMPNAIRKGYFASLLEHGRKSRKHRPS